MKSRETAKTIELLYNDIETNILKEHFMAAVIKHMSRPFPFIEFAYLLSEFTDKNKRILANSINLKLKAPADQNFPDTKFIQLLKPRMNKYNEKIIILQAIIRNVFPLYDEIRKNGVEDHLAAQEEIINRSGAWHYYWSLLLFPLEDDRISVRLSELKSELPIPTKKQVIDQTNILSIPLGENEKERSKESKIIFRERELRQKAEKEIEALRSQLRTINKKHDHLVSEHAQIVEHYEIKSKRVMEQQALLDIERKKVVSLERDKNDIVGQLKKSLHTIELQNEQERVLKENLDTERAHYEVETSRLVQELSSLMVSGSKVDNINDLIQVINTKIDDLYVTMSNIQTLDERKVQREKISEGLLLMNSLEAFFSPDKQLSIAPPMEHILSVDEPVVLPNSEVEKSIPQKTEINGTFYRRDHGGYIVLENEESFNIPESMVNTIGLEHEAEVSCEPTNRSSGTTAHYIRLLFQGDDSYAPIQQYMGYIKICENYKYYCVDMNNPENRFEIHFKDVEKQQPLDGLPCLFNVTDGKTIARISKIYTQSEISEGNQEKIIKTKQTNDRSKVEKRTGERFLEGCKIVIVGGLAKWFESVVTETGAELIHDTGDNPDRVHSHLRRANAMFLLLSANSHKATWSCMEVAKENAVPHFKIEGSKSNLRMQLWANQSVIRGDQNK